MLGRLDHIAVLTGTIIEVVARDEQHLVGAGDGVMQAHRVLVVGNRDCNAEVVDGTQLLS